MDEDFAVKNAAEIDLVAGRLQLKHRPVKIRKDLPQLFAQYQPWERIQIVRLAKAKNIKKIYTTEAA